MEEFSLSRWDMIILVLTSVKWFPGLGIGGMVSLDLMIVDCVGLSVNCSLEWLGFV